MKLRTDKFVDVDEWDKLVLETYGKPYALQQQDGCKGRGFEFLIVPDEAEDYENDEIPEVVNGEKMGVSFAAWLKRDPKAPLSKDGCGNDSWCIDLWWHRNFYPSLQMVANDLHAKGLLESGKYTIVIDW